MHELHIFAFSCSVADALVVPLGQTERAIVLLLHPVGDAVEVERMVAVTPGDVALTIVLRHVRHAVNTVLHQIVVADGAFVLLSLPLPHDDCIPLLDSSLAQVSGEASPFWLLILKSIEDFETDGSLIGLVCEDAGFVFKDIFKCHVDLVFL